MSRLTEFKNISGPSDDTQDSSNSENDQNATDQNVT